MRVQANFENKKSLEVVSNFRETKVQVKQNKAKKIKQMQKPDISQRKADLKDKK